MKILVYILAAICLLYTVEIYLRRPKLGRLRKGHIFTGMVLIIAAGHSFATTNPFWVSLGLGFSLLADRIWGDPTRIKPPKNQPPRFINPDAEVVVHRADEEEELMDKEKL